ncbi:MAG: universal stress protein [Rubripirellula sp.]
MKRFKNILLYAGMEQNEAAVNRAVKLALENNARLTVMDVVKPIPRALGMLTAASTSEELQRLVGQDHREKLLEAAGEYIDTGIELDVVVATGDPATEIVRQVLVADHDLVVKTVNAEGEGRIFGSIARSLLRICPCPLWLLKPEIHGDFNKILAAVDLDATDTSHLNLNRDIMELAAGVAERENAELHLVSAWDVWMESALRRRAGDAEVDAAIEAKKARVETDLKTLIGGREADAIPVHPHLQRGNPAAMVRMVAEKIEADLLVMGTVCRTGAAGFLIGNTAETVLSGVNCSILALKPDGFVSPVLPADAVS